jgi:signal transduction histidine kinase
LKLLTRTSIYYISFSIIGFLLGGMLMYYFISRIINNRTDDTLITEKELIEEQIANTEHLPDFTGLFGHQIEVTIYNDKVEKKESIKDTLIFDVKSGEMHPYRYLSTTDTKKNKTYSIDIYKPLLETNQLVADILLVLLVMFFSLLVILVIVNYFISRSIWQPFHDTLLELKTFNVESGDPLNFEQTSIAEFRQLNKVLKQMSLRMRRDFMNLKEFTENVSHEIQTPLAIIKTKLELFIQNEKLDEEQMQLIQTIYESTSRLSRLNQALNLIAKIENHQFQQSEPCNISDLIDKYLVILDDLIEDKQLTIVKNIDKGVMVELNPMLAEILLNNLISNAIKHNICNGKIEIVLTPQSLVISNTGDKPEISPSQLFRRFQKANKASNSLGLGLSIVNKIVRQYQYDIYYDYKSGYHTLQLLFRKK